MEGEHQKLSRRRVLIIALVILIVVLAPIGVFANIVADSRSPPFPVAWESSLPGSQALYSGPILQGSSVYSLRLLNYTNANIDECKYQAVSTSFLNGSRLWSDQITTSGITCLDAYLLYYDHEVYFIGEDSVEQWQLVVKAVDASTGAILSSSHELQPGRASGPEGLFATSYNGTGYVVGVMGAENVSVEALSLRSGGGVLWDRNVTIPGNTAWATGEPVLYADAKGIALFVNDQSRVFESSFLADGSPGYLGYLPGNGTVIDGAPVIGGVVYYLSGIHYPSNPMFNPYLSNPRVYGANLSDGSLVANFSVAYGFSTSEPVEELSAAGNELIVTDSQVATAFDFRGNTLWSLSVQPSGGSCCVGPVGLADGLVFLQGQSSQVYFLNSSIHGLTYDASYMIVNASSGQVLWNSIYSAWINTPPWTPTYPDLLPSYLVSGVNNGQLLVEGRQSLYGVEISRLI